MDVTCLWHTGTVIGAARIFIALDHSYLGEVIGQNSSCYESRHAAAHYYRAVFPKR
jgi:hypothetical protein